MDETLQREVAARMVAILAARDVHVVLVGSTAVIAHDLFPRTSKDADALAPANLPLDEARGHVHALAEATGGVVEEVGWGTLRVSRYDRGDRSWSMDLLVPEAGPIPKGAADRIHRLAVQTDIGKAAIPEHVLVMKAVAWGDCIGKGEPDRAIEYESDLDALRRVWVGEPRWGLVQELLAEYPSARAMAAARRINAVFGARLPVEEGWDVA